MDVEGKDGHEILEKSNHCISFISMIPCTSHFRCFQPPHHSVEKHSTANVKEEKKLGGWKTFPFIIGNEICSTAAAGNMTANMIVYLTTQFNIKNIEATNIINISNGGCQLAPIVGAFLSDSYLGRFWTISIGSVVSFLALVLLTLIAIISSLRPPACSPQVRAAGSCHGPSRGQYAVLFFYIALIIVASGGVNFNSSAFGADQFDKASVEGMRKIQTFFNWYYFGLYSSFIIATTVIVYIQANVSWAWGFGICAVLTGISVVMFFGGTKFYIRSRPEGSPFTGLAQVVVACIRKRHLHLPPSNAQDYYYGKTKEPSRLTLTQQLRFLNKAAIKTSQEFPSEGQMNPNPWKLCSVEQVEDLKSILKTLPILSCAIIPNIMNSQHMTFSVLQALTMDRHLSPGFQIPAASFMVFSLLSSAIVLLIYDKAILPFIARTRLKITYLQRIGIGMFVYCVGLGVAAIVESKRLNVQKSAAMVPMSALWLIPQNVIMGLADPFQSVGWIDFSYNEFPEAVRSTAVSVVSITAAPGFYFSSLLVSFIHRKSDWLTNNLGESHLDYFYALLCGMGMLNFAYFIIWTRWYRYKEKIYGVQNISTH